MIKDPIGVDGFDNLTLELGRKNKNPLAKSVKNYGKGKVSGGPDRIIITASRIGKRISPDNKAATSGGDLSREIEASKLVRKKSKKSKKKKTQEDDNSNGGKTILSDFQSMKSMNKFVLADSPYQDPLGDPLGNSGKTVKKYGQKRS